MEYKKYYKPRKPRRLSAGPVSVNGTQSTYIEVLLADPIHSVEVGVGDDKGG